MRTPEEILSRYTDIESEHHFVIHVNPVGDCITVNQCFSLIEQAQKEALEFAASKVYPFSNNKIDITHAERIRKSILKGNI